MGQILHGSAKTTYAVRTAIQRSKATFKELAQQYGINPKTVAKWKKRQSIHDALMGPKKPASTVLTQEEEAMAVAFRRYTLLSLDDCLYALQSSIPHLTRFSLYRCFQRHRFRLPNVKGEKLAKKTFKHYPIGYFHIDIVEVRTEVGKLYLLVAIDRTSKFSYTELHECQTKSIAAIFLNNLIATVPYKINTVMTDNEIQFTNRTRDTHAFQHILNRVCNENSIKHRLTKPKHPWTNGQVEHMNRTLMEATIKRYYCQSHKQLKSHIYDFAKRLKTLKGLTPYEHLCQIWTKEPERFRHDPFQFTLGLNKYNILRSCNHFTWRK